MTNDDIQPFSEMMTLTAQQYGKPMSAALIGLYFDALNHLPIETIRVSLSKHLRNTDIGQFMPKIADIIRECEGGGDAAALKAMKELQDAARSVGYYGSVKFAGARRGGAK